MCEGINLNSKVAQVTIYGCVLLSFVVVKALEPNTEWLLKLSLKLDELEKIFSPPRKITQSYSSINVCYLRKVKYQASQSNIPIFTSFVCKALIVLYNDYLIRLVQKNAYDEKLFKHFNDRMNSIECNRSSVSSYLLKPLTNVRWVLKHKFFFYLLYIYIYI